MYSYHVFLSLCLITLRTIINALHKNPSTHPDISPVKVCDMGVVIVCPCISTYFATVKPRKHSFQVPESKTYLNYRNSQGWIQDFKKGGGGSA